MEQLEVESRLKDALNQISIARALFERDSSPLSEEALKHLELATEQLYIIRDDYQFNVGKISRIIKPHIVDNEWSRSKNLVEKYSCCAADIIILCREKEVQHVSLSEIRKLAFKNEIIDNPSFSIQHLLNCLKSSEIIVKNNTVERGIDYFLGTMGMRFYKEGTN